MNIIDKICIPLFIGSLWVSFGFIIPVLLFKINNWSSIIVAIILMLFSHFLTFIITRKEVIQNE
jgi:hypothetical protein